MVDDCGQGENADYLCLMPTSPDFTKHTNNAEDANNVDFNDDLEIHRYVSIYGK